jgi:hypothetical protein
LVFVSFIPFHFRGFFLTKKIGKSVTKAGLERMKVISPDIVEGSLVIERHDVVSVKLPGQNHKL